MTVQFDYDKPLACPNCGTCNLHHSKIDIFNRQQDAGDGLHLHIEKLSMAIDTEVENNPSERHDGLTIEFWCEGCDTKPVFALWQHKGRTYTDLQASK